MNTMTSKCVICSSENYKSIDYINSTFKKDECFLGKKIRVCEQCGFGEIYPKISNKKLKNFYENSYRNKDSTNHINFRKMHHKINRSFASRSLAQLSLSLPCIYKKSDSLNFLDIGAGAGGSFIAAQMIFDKVNLFAMEENLEAISFYKEKFKDITILKNIDDKPEFMDVILMSHSLEHFDAHDIPSILESLYTATNKDGVVIIEIPNADLNDKFMLNRYEDVPHLCFFSMQSIKKIVKESKFKLVYLSTVGSLNSEDSYRVQDRSKNKTRKAVKFFLKTLKIYPVFRFFMIKIIEYKNFYIAQNTPFNYGKNRSSIRLVLQKGGN
jgi:SAM-dependent methyltransferase